MIQHIFKVTHKMVDHHLDVLDAHVLAGRVVETGQTLLGLRVLGHQSDDDIFVQVLSSWEMIYNYP
jgi:hypothetical protein